MQIKKAVITSAGRSQRNLPLQTLVDRDGTAKSALQIIIEEAASAGVTDIAIVIAPGDQTAYRTAAGPKAEMLNFFEQSEPLGYGHALCCARNFTGNQPFLHLVGDHLYLSRTDRRCAQQLVQVATKEECSVSAVQATHESKLPFYGAVGGRHLRSGEENLYEIETVIEKPTPTEAEQRLIVPGLRAGNYLCFFGMHVLTPLVMDILQERVKAAQGQAVPLSDSLAMLAGRERYLALEVSGQRYNIGVRYGLLMAQLALALDGHDREEIMTQMLELLATKQLPVVSS